MLALPQLRILGAIMREPGFIKRAPRVDTNFKTSLTDSDGGKLAVIVTDLSKEGCRLETDGTLKIGEHVQIDVPKYGTFSAQIRWALGNEAGAVFLDPVFLP
jgi:PilZ domain-containing protein